MDKTHNKRWTVCICLALALSTAGVYWQVHDHGFIDFDDDLYVTQNPTVQKGLTWEGVKWAFTTNQAWNWHPLVWLTHMLDCELFGLDAGGHHLANVFYHIVNSVLLFLVFKRMTGNLWCSAFVAGLFALHPLHVESVAWASERKDTLSTLFWLLTMWFYIRYTERPRAASYVPVAISLGLGLMAKQMLVTLPLVLLLLDYWPLRRFDLERRSEEPRKRRARTSRRETPAFYRCFAEKLPLLALSAIASLMIYIVQLNATLVKTSAEIPLAYRLGNIPVAYAKYMGKMFVPTHLGILYPHPERNLQLWEVLAAGLLVVVICVVVIRFGRKYRWLMVGWFWYLGTLVPVIGLIQVGLQQMPDRYTYVPLIGLFIILSWGPAELLGKLRFAKPALAVGGIAVISICSMMTWRQLSYWKDHVALYKHTVAVTKNNDILYYSLGFVLQREGRIDEAIYHWTQAVTIKPDQPTIHKQLAILLTREGKLDLAIEHYRHSLKYKPYDVEVRKNMNTLLHKLKRY